MSESELAVPHPGDSIEVMGSQIKISFRSGDLSEERLKEVEDNDRKEQKRRQNAF